MRLVSLALQGYRQFASPVTVPFYDGLSGICGPNGAGKSKLIEAIGYALFGPAGPVLAGTDKKDHVASVVKHPDVRLKVELTFELGRERYRVERGAGTAAFYVGDARRPEVSGASDVTKKARALLNLSPHTYLGTFVARQRDVAGLLAKTEGERTDLLNTLIGVKQVEAAIALAADEVRTRLREADRLRGAVQTPVSHARLALNVATRAAEDAERAAAAAAAAMAAARSRRDEAVRAAAGIRGREGEAEGLRRALDSLARHAESVRTQLATAEGERDALGAHEAELGRVQSDVRDTADAAALEYQWVRLKTIAVLETRLGEATSRLEGPLTKRRAQREALAAQIAAAELRLEELAEPIAECQRNAAAAAADARREERALAALKEQRANAFALGPQATCVACGIVLADGRLETMVRHLDDEAGARRARLGEHEAAVSAATTELCRLQAEQARVGDWLKAARARLARDYGAVLGEIEALARETDALRTQIACERGSLAPDFARARYNASAHALQSERAARHEQALRRAERYAALVSQRAAIEERIALHTEELAAVALREAETAARLAQVAPDPDELQQAVDEEERAVNDASVAESAWEKDAAAAGDARGEAKDAAAALEQAEGAEAAAGEAARHLHVAQRTEELLRGVLQSISAEARPRIEEFLHEWLRPLFGERFRSIRLDDGFGILADNGSGERDISHFSGGEQTILAIMLRAAIALFCRERAGFQTGFLILDEVFGDQDARRRQQLVQFLDEIKSRYPQILVVNHIDEITARLDTIIQVVQLTENESTVRVSR